MKDLKGRKELSNEREVKSVIVGKKGRKKKSPKQAKVKNTKEKKIEQQSQWKQSEQKNRAQGRVKYISVRREVLRVCSEISYR